MTIKIHPLEQRAQKRQPAATTPLSWAHENATRVFVGWLRDTATSNLAFVTATRDRPLPGETIELTLAPNTVSPTRHRVRVVRTAHDDRFFSLVGCTSESIDDRGH